MTSRFRSFHLLLLLIIFSGVSSAQSNTVYWSKIPLGAASVYEEAPQHVEIFSKDTIYIRTSTGFFYSRNGGASFQQSRTAETGKEMTFNFPTANVGFMAGTDGLLRKTTNGGVDWTDLSYVSNADFWGVDFLNVSTGLVAGENGSIFKAANGGLTWKQISSGTTQFLTVVRWITNSIVLAGGYGGVMLRSIDGGETFAPVVVPQQSATFDIEFYSPEFPYIENGQQWNISLYEESFILACGAGGVILRSTDMGISWTDAAPYEANPLLRKTFLEISIADTKKMLAYGQLQYGGSITRSLYESTDGGKNWSPYSLPDSLLPVMFSFADHYTLFGVNFATGEQYAVKYDYSKKDIILLTPNLDMLSFSGKQIIPLTWTSRDVQQVTLQYSTDGGGAWNLIKDVPAVSAIYQWEIPETPSLNYRVRAKDKTDENIFDVSDYRFTVLAEFWQSYPAGVDRKISAASFPDIGIAYLAGEKGLILKSVDSAKTWRRIDLGISANLYSISFCSSDIGIAAGDSGVVMKTVNGGLTWNPVTSLSRINVKKVIFADALTALILPRNSTDLYISKNGGESWTVFTAPKILNDVCFVRGVGYAVGEGGLILKSSGNINAWLPLSVGSTENFMSVSSYSDDVAYIGLAQGVLLCTKDGGESWLLSSIGENRNLVEVKAVSHNTAFLLCADGYIYSTDNNGISWQNQSFRFHNILAQYGYALAFSPIRTMQRGILTIAAGDHGNIIRKSYGIPEHKLQLIEPPQNDLIVHKDSLTIRWRGAGIRYVNVSLFDLSVQKMKRIVSGLLLREESYTIPVTEDMPLKFRMAISTDDDPALDVVGDSVYFVVGKRIKDFAGEDSLLQSANSVSFNNARNGAASNYGWGDGRPASVSVTHNGNDWQSTFTSPVAASDSMYVFNVRVHAVDSLNYIFSGVSSWETAKLFGTMDGGKTWQLRTRAGLDSFSLKGNFIFRDVKNWLYRGMWKTTDAEFTWQRTTFPNGEVRPGTSGRPNLINAELWGGGRGFARSEYGGIYTTINNGDMWIKKYQDVELRTFRFNVINKDVLYAVVLDTALQFRRSQDGGATWNAVASRNRLDVSLESLFDIEFVSDSVGVYRFGGTLYLTEDQGTTWRELKFKSFNYVFHELSKKWQDNFISVGADKSAYMLLHNIRLQSSPVAAVDITSPVAVPERSALSQNFPNPFNPSTTIIYELPKETHVTLTVYSILGEEVAVLADGLEKSGRHQAVWNGRTRSGMQAATGVYICRFIAGDFIRTVKMQLVK